MGPSLGWMGGWAIVVADVIVMANLAQIAGLYSFLGSYGEAPLKAMIIGSTPHRLIHVTETPVLVVRGSLSVR